MEGYDAFDLAMANLAIYVFFMFFVVQNTYQIFKAIKQKKLKKQNIQRMEEKEGKYIDAIVEEEVNYQHIIYLNIVAIIISATHYPFGIYHYIEAHPIPLLIGNVNILAILYNGIFLGLGASTGYNVAEKTVNFVLSLIGRIRKTYQ